MSLVTPSGIISAPPGPALDAANLNLKDIREGVAEDTAVTYLSLDRDLLRQAALQQQQGFADHLVSIVQDRLDAGQGTLIDLTVSRLTAAQVRLARLRAEDETAADKAHLARLIGLPEQGLGTTSDSVPTFPAISPDLADNSPLTSPAVESAYATAHAKQETAFGEARYLWRPQIYFEGQYSRFAKYTNIQDYYFRFQQNNAAAGVQITIPVYDMGHRAKAREAAADASRALHEADMVAAISSSTTASAPAIPQPNSPPAPRLPPSTSNSPSNNSTSSSSS